MVRTRCSRTTDARSSILSPCRKARNHTERRSPISRHMSDIADGDGSANARFGSRAMHLRTLERRARKHDVVPSKTGHGVLWGRPEDWDPPAKLRVWRWWCTPQVVLRLYTNKSLPRNTTMYETLQGNITGRVMRGCDCLELEGFADRVETESMLVTINSDRVVMMMIHL